MSATPGPWTYEPQDGTPGHCLCAQIFGPDGNGIATVDPSQPDAEANANARIMAASQDMLAALEDIIQRNEIQHWFNLDKARAAVAKAKG